MEATLNPRTSNAVVHTTKSRKFVVSRCTSSKLNKEGEEESFLSETEWRSPEKVIWLKSESEPKFDVASFTTIVVDYLSKVQELKQIYILRESDITFHIWSIIDELNDKVKKSIYEQELELIKFFSRSIYFDFYIGVLSDAEYIISAGGTLLFKRE
ncbi:MAG: hypothetical protein HY805_00455 [Nitrospirae bacterium]|nr:hypothetical protein [Nitrospirota bacterium]